MVKIKCSVEIVIMNNGFISSCLIYVYFSTSLVVFVSMLRLLGVGPVPVYALPPWLVVAPALSLAL